MLVFAAQVAGLELDLQDSARELRVKKEKVTDAKTQLEESQQCTVCLERAVRVSLPDCGHTFCAECVAGLVVRVCPLCQQAIVGAVHPVFFG